MTAEARPPAVEREIARVLVRYARLADERDWSAIGEVFVEEARADYGGLILRDRDAIVAMLRRALDGCGPTQHLLGTPIVDIDSAGGVKSWVQVRAAHRGAGDLSELVYDCMGEYHDAWTPTAAGWRIIQRRMVVRLEFGSRRVLR